MDAFKIDKMLEKFAERCVPACNETYKKHVFFKHEQAQSESLDQYITGLMKLCDWLILGVTDNRVREKLLGKYQIIKATQVTRSQANEISGKAVEIPDHEEINLLKITIECAKAPNLIHTLLFSTYTTCQQRLDLHRCNDCSAKEHAPCCPCQKNTWARKPLPVEEVQDKLINSRQKQVFHYNLKGAALPELQAGQIVRMKKTGESTWSKAVCKRMIGQRSYVVISGSQTYRRNC